MTIAFPKSGPVTLRTNLADYPVSRALKAGELRSDLVKFEFSGFKQAYEGFKPMVREARFDAGELAIVTFLQARQYGKPLALLPATLMGRFQHHCIQYNATGGELSPKQIEGRRVAVRSYTQTTGVWVRAILQHEYGVDLARVNWMTAEDPHLAEFSDPPFMTRVAPGKKIDQMLLDGEADAVIQGVDLTSDPRVRHLIAHPHEAAVGWSRKYGTVPINHLFVVNRSLLDTRPDVIREIYRLLLESKKAAPSPSDGIDFHPFGIEANRKPLEMIIQYALEQQIIARRVSVDELFEETARVLR